MTNVNGEPNKVWNRRIMRAAGLLALEKAGYRLGAKMGAGPTLAWKATDRANRETVVGLRTTQDYWLAFVPEDDAATGAVSFKTLRDITGPLAAVVLHTAPEGGSVARVYLLDGQATHHRFAAVYAERKAGGWAFSGGRGMWIETDGGNGLCDGADLAVEVRIPPMPAGWDRLSHAAQAEAVAAVVATARCTADDPEEDAEPSPHDPRAPADRVLDALRDIGLGRSRDAQAFGTAYLDLVMDTGQVDHHEAVLIRLAQVLGTWAVGRLAQEAEGAVVELVRDARPRRAA